jgi:DNA-binding MarR family transcriptional regulator
MVLQLLAATEKTGELEVRGHDEEHRGFLGVSRGRLASARFEDEDGYLALGAVFAIEQGDFEFLPQDQLEREDLTGDLEELLQRAGEERERIRAIRDVIPSDHVRFRLSERATERGQITLAPAQWKALLLVDGQRDLAALAGRLEMPRLDTQQLLADLVRAGLVDTIPPPDGASVEPSRAYRRLPPMQPIPPTTTGERVVLRGRIADYPLETIVQLLAETKKTGRLEVRAGRDASTLGMSDGRLVSATAGEEEGELGLGAAFTALEGEFEFVPMSEAPATNLTGQLDPLLDRAAAVRDRIVAIRGIIPNERARFTLSERATRNPEIVLTPEQWRVLLGVNGERDVIEVAEHVRMRRLPVMMVIADLVRGGYVDVLPAAEATWPQVERRKTSWAPAAAPAAEEPILEEPIAVE